MLRLIKKYLSYLIVIPEYRFDSIHSGKMDIRWENGRLALNSSNANYSFNKLHKVLQKGLRNVDLTILADQPILNLGLAAGSSVDIVRNEIGIDNRIDSVEIDPSILSTVRTYFGIDGYKSHQIFLIDAWDYLSEFNDQYGLVIIDLFIDRTVDSRFLSHEFFELLEQNLSPKGQVMFNFIGNSPHPFIQHLGKQHEYLVESVKDNLVLIYRRTDVS